MKPQILLELFPNKRGLCYAPDGLYVYFEFARETKEESTWIFINNADKKRISITIKKLNPFSQLLIKNDTNLKISVTFFENGLRTENISRNTEIRKYLKDIDHLCDGSILELSFNAQSKPMYNSEIQYSRRYE